jgi:transcriptional regulator GlxA family with amidase domain
MPPMMRKTLWIACLCAGLVVVAAAATIMLSPDTPQRAAIAAPVDRAEQARTIAAMRPATTKQRPVVALLALNEGTEVADLLSAFGMLRAADVADVVVVARAQSPVRLYPGDLRALPQATFAAFDRLHPGGADYVVVPAMEPHDDPAVLAWLVAQHQAGARIASICNGAQTMAAAGLLDGRRATSHWSTVQALRKQHPTMHWVRDRRYVTDGAITTSTGVSSSLPLMLALTEAMGGHDAAARTAHELGIDHWDARHATAAFRLTNAHRWTFVRNKLGAWRRREAGLPIGPGVDEIALGLAIDAYSRTELVSVASAASAAQVRSKRGLVLLPGRVAPAGSLGDVDAIVPSGKPGKALDQVLARISSEYDPRTARYVALTLEYPWPR